MYRITKHGRYLTKYQTWTTIKEDAETHAAYEDVKMLAHLGTIEADNLPCFILTGLHEDDTLTVICHWHAQPSKDDIRDMMSSCLDKYVCFNLSMVAYIHTPTEN